MIDNVNSSWIKRHAKKIKLILITTVTTLSVGIGGLFIHNKIEHERSRQQYFDKYYSHTYEEDTSMDEIIEEEVKEVVTTIENDNSSYEYTNVDIPFEDRTITFKDIDTSSFINEIRSYKVTYEGSEFFNVKESLNRYNSMKEYDSKHDLVYITGNKVNEDLLRKQILSNNQEFISRQSNNKYSEYSSTYFDLAFKAIVTSINKQLAESDNIDIYQLDDNLANLKVLNSNISGNGQVLPDNTILTINQSLTTKFGGNNFFYFVACHETNHLIQVASNKEKENEGYSTNNGIAYTWDDLAVNALGYSWFSEGSAEKLMLSNNDVPSDLVAYQDYVKSIDSLTLATIIRDDVDELTIPRLSLQPDLNRLFKIFNCQNDSEKEEIINMMFSFEIIYNKDKGFYNASGYSDYKYEYRLYSSIAQTLTKTFYYNLNEKLTTGEESLSNIFGMITLYESDMNRLTKYYDSSRYDINKDFISMYTKIQYSFFSNIAKSSGLTVDEVYSMYTEYYNSAKGLNKSNNLDNNEMLYFDDMFDSRETIKPNENLSSYKTR